MAEELLLLAIVIFSVRGFFLGFVGVVSHFLGFIFSYFVAYRYNEPVALYFAENTSISLSPGIIQIGASVLLFISTMIITKFAISSIFKLLMTVLPGLKNILDHHSIGSRILGVFVNASIGVVIVLVCIWTYQLFVPAAASDTQLNRIANNFGNAFIPEIAKYGDIDISPFIHPNTISQPTSTLTSSNPNIHSSNSPAMTGSAVIQSEENPNKKLVLENTKSHTSVQLSTYQETQAHTPGTDTKKTTPSNTFNTLLQNENVQQLLRNPKIQDFAQKQIEKHPEKVKDIISNPQLRLLLGIEETAQ